MNQLSAKISKRQIESDSVSGKTNDTHNYRTKNSTGEEFTIAVHRGASGYVPERTFKVYDKSHNELGVSYIKVNLQRTKDDYLVATHGKEVSRTTSGHGYIGQLILKELKQLNVGSWSNQKRPEYARNKYKDAKVPTLDEILNRYSKDTNRYIETKSPDVYPDTERRLLDTLDEYDLSTQKSPRRGHVMIQSFSGRSLKKVHHMNVNIPPIRLVNEFELRKATSQDLKNIKFHTIGVGLKYTDLNIKNTRHLKDLGFLVHPYTVDDENQMGNLNQYGIDGVFTNFANRYREVSGTQQ